ncbi:MAG: hypothetical protein ABL982_22620 [Vicinamibacterales bacterium]
MHLTTALTLGLVVGLSPIVVGQTAATPPTRYVAIGCLTRQGPAAAPRFVLTDPRGEKPTVYRVQGDAAQLAPHVGHTVEVAGTLTAPAAPAAQDVLKAGSLAWIASSCSTSTVRSGVRPCASGRPEGRQLRELWG